MSFSAFDAKQFNEILDAQIELNVEYSGKEWMDIPNSSFAAASFAEMGELLESGPRVGDDIVGWKWWKPYLENDVNNMKIEAVDIIHFAISSLYKKYKGERDLIKNHYKDCREAYVTANVKDESSTGVMYDLLVSFSVFSVGVLVDDTEKEQVMDMFVYLIDALCRFSNMTPDEMFNLYMKKNELNHKRVEGGYKEDKYEKYDENGEEDNVKLFK